MSPLGMILLFMEAKGKIYYLCGHILETLVSPWLNVSEEIEFTRRNSLLVFGKSIYLEGGVCDDCGKLPTFCLCPSGECSEVSCVLGELKPSLVGEGLLTCLVYSGERQEASRQEKWSSSLIQLPQQLLPGLGRVIDGGSEQVPSHCGISLAESKRPASDPPQASGLLDKPSHPSPNCWR